MRSKKILKRVLEFSLLAIMVFAVGSSAFANTQALPNGTIVSQNGTKYLTDSSGNKYSGWFIDSKENWYYFKESDKSMKSGWHHDDKDGYWYYLNQSDGRMETGWQTIDGKEYYFQPVRDMGNYHFSNEEERWLYQLNSKIPFGAMYANTITPNGSKVDNTGAKENTSEKNTNSDNSNDSNTNRDFKTYVGEYTLENNLDLVIGSSLWLSITKIENGKIWANVQAGAGSGSGEAYGEVAGAEISNGKFTILLDNILPPTGIEKVQPYTIEFTFSDNQTINTTVSNCIYDTLAMYIGTLHCLSNSQNVDNNAEKSKMDYSLYIGKYSDLEDYQNEYFDATMGGIKYLKIESVNDKKIYGSYEYGYTQISKENFERGIAITNSSFTTNGTIEYWEKADSKPYETTTYISNYSLSMQNGEPVIIKDGETVFYKINGEPK